jgi:predicted Holliday junction resolvase-like endonuclease
MTMTTLEELRRSRRLRACCPECDKEFSIHQARLFDATKPLPDYASEYLAAARTTIAQRHEQLKAERKKLKERSSRSAATSGVGQALEMLSASLPGLPVAAQDCRALLKPIDYVAFGGASRGEIETITFIEAKSGKQRLSAVQKAIRKAVESDAVSLRIANHQLPNKEARR